ncbi:MAG: DNA recombination protein RmuC [Desulfobacterota bacterium]|nr:DNA recombination protein RmuC [Thermodesulfobacteriota bacterium]
MEGIYLLIGAIVTLAILLFTFFLMEQRLRKLVEGVKAEVSSQAVWSLIQQQIDHLREQINEGLSRNIAQLTQQQEVINAQLRGITEQVNRQLQSSSGEINRRLDNAARVIGDVQRNIGELSEASRRIFEVGKDIATLQEILQPPKLRGGLGELFLGELLSQILPAEFFTLQHSFSTGERVDAVIRLGERLVPIDSKFPLDNFRRMIESKTEEERKGAQKMFVRDVKKHIDDVASKYILPQEGTYDFALLYIPAENVYYETITKDETFGEDRGILSYALKKRVIPVSPNSFFAYLQVIVLGLRGLKIEKDAHRILKSLSGLNRELNAFQGEFQLLGKHLANAANKYEEARRRLERFGLKLEQIETGPAPPVTQGKHEPNQDG